MRPQRSRATGRQPRVLLRIPDNNDGSAHKTGIADKTNILPVKNETALQWPSGLLPQRHSSPFAPKSSRISHRLPLLHLVDPGKVILKVKGREKKRHYTAQVQSDRFCGVEVLLDVGPHFEHS